MNGSLDPVAGEETATADQAAMRARLAGTNINEETFLATDYLNHFNEIIMLLEMVPDMPECLEDCKAWRPKSYAEHFRDSSFSDKELAIAAYEQAPEAYRQPFDVTIESMNRLVALGIDRIDAALADGNGDVVAAEAKRTSRALQKLVDVASAIIHGSATPLEQAEIDALLTG